MTDYIVQCVSKTDKRFSDCRCITRIGVRQHNGMAAGFLTREQAYKIVMDGRDRLLVPKGNGYVGVEAVEREGGPITSGPIPMILQLTIFCIDPNVKPEKQIESDRTESF